uniref:Uncharacterized protein n=1 Tax=Nelumbo nucifera TaxID=4432 RepID=A0A822Y0C1_NELNU|nr:TPA_asm: hypothetical protein HUJ06_027375 [Nelumbo nucifera]
MPRMIILRKYSEKTHYLQPKILVICSKKLDLPMSCLYLVNLREGKFMGICYVFYHIYVYKNRGNGSWHQIEWTGETGFM